GRKRGTLMLKVSLRSTVSLIAVVASLTAVTASANAASREELEKQVEELKKQIAAQQAQLDVLSSQIRDVKTSSANQYADTQRQAAESPKFSIKNGRPTFESADGKYTAQIRALAQFDAAYYSQGASAATLPAAYGPDLSSGTNFRRVYLGIQGKLFGDWSYNFNYDFGGSGGTESPGRIQSVYLQYDGLKPFALRVGAYPPPANIEDATSAADTLFLERNAPSDLQRNIAGGDGRDAVTALYAGDELYTALSFTGGKVQDSAVFDEQQALLGRASYLVYNSLDAHWIVGANGTYVIAPPDSVASGSPVLATTPGATALNSFTLSAPPELTVDSNGIRLVNTTALPADHVTQWGVETAANLENFYAQAGYYDFEVDRSPIAYRVCTAACTAGSNVNTVTQIVNPANNHFDGWYVQGSWVLTGEAKGYNPATAAFTTPKPAHPFDLDNAGWGAWELAARYSALDLNDNETSPLSVITAWTGATTRTYTFYNTVRGGEQKAFTLGLNWYPNDNLRFALDYQLIEIDRLQSGATPGAITGVTTTTTGTPVIPTISADQTVQAVALRAQFGF